MLFCQQSVGEEGAPALAAFGNYFWASSVGLTEDEGSPTSQVTTTVQLIADRSHIHRCRWSIAFGRTCCANRIGLARKGGTDRTEFSNGSINSHLLSSIRSERNKPLGTSGTACGCERKRFKLALRMYAGVWGSSQACGGTTYVEEKGIAVRAQSHH